MFSPFVANVSPQSRSQPSSAYKRFRSLPSLSSLHLQSLSSTTNAYYIYLVKTFNSNLDQLRPEVKMFSLKNLIFQVLVLTIIAASLTNCSPSNRLSKKVSHRLSEPATDNDNNAAASASTSIDKDQFEASDMRIIIPRFEKPEGEKSTNIIDKHQFEASDTRIIIPRSEKPEGERRINIIDKAQFEASGMALIIHHSGEPEGDGLFVCETSVASPWIWNSRRLADWFSNFNGWYCCNWNVNGGGCSHVMTVEDASTAICGREGCIRCEDMASNINRIVEYCQRDNKAGGVSYLDQGSHIVLY